MTEKTDDIEWTKSVERPYFTMEDIDAALRAMKKMARHKNVTFNMLNEPTWEQAQYAVLCDIRDELQTLNRKMDCWEGRTNEGFSCV